MINDSPAQDIAEQRLVAIREQLTQALKPSDLAIEDQSHMHVGHAGAKSGKGHFAVKIVSEVFTGKSLIQRHRAVYDALEDLMNSDIHALSITALAPGEQ